MFFLVLFKKVVATKLDEKVEELKNVGATIEPQVSRGVALGVKKAIRDIPAATVKETSRTVAELGSGNSPVDIISFDKEGKKYFLISNSNRSVMRLNYQDIADSKESLLEPVEEFAVSKGVEYVSLPSVNVIQMDNLDANNILLLKRDSDGQLVLRSRTTKWM